MVVENSWWARGFCTSAREVFRPLSVKSLVRATSHTRLRARDQYIPSTLVGGKGRTSPCSLHTTTLEGPTECVSECKMDVKSMWVLTWHRTDRFMVSWIIFKNHLLEVGLTQSWRHWHSECSQPFIYSILSCVRTHLIEIRLNSIWLRVQSHMASH